MEKLWVLAAVMGLSSASIYACKLRDSTSAEKKASSDPNAEIAQDADSGLDLSKSPVFVRCLAPKESNSKVDASIHHSQKSGAAQITYRIAAGSEVIQKGRWDNHDEPSPYQYIYSFGDLRFILTNEQIVQGSLPATLVGNDASGKYIEQTLICSKT